MSIDTNKRASIVAHAMKRAFGTLLDWERPKLLHNFGPNDLDQIEKFENRHRDTCADALEVLEGLTDEAIQEISVQLSDPYRIGEDQWLGRFAGNIEQLNRFKPPAIAYGFGHPQYKADFGYWGRMPTLSFHEVTLLSVGAAPKSMSDESISKLLKLQESGKELWSAQIFLLQQHEVFRRHFYHGGWSFSSATPEKVKSWIDEMELPVHPDFYSALDRRISLKTPHNEPSVSKSMTSQERETLLKLIAAMACEQYDYDPVVRRSTVPANIREDIERVGLTMDDKTIRKWLKEASEFVAPEYWNGE